MFRLQDLVKNRGGAILPSWFPFGEKETMTVPLWVLKHSFQAYGSKMPGRPPNTANYEYHNSCWPGSQMEAEKCVVCEQSIQGKAWVFRKSRYVHVVCETMLDAEGNPPKKVIALPQSHIMTNRRARRAGFYNKNRSDDPYPIPAGNLGDSQYRFWIGVENDDSKFGMCRCCRMSIYGEKERESHKDDEHYHIGGSACTHLLIEAYKRLLAKRECVVCNKNTVFKKWGVPICGKECERAWKFSQINHTVLQIELRAVKAIALAHEAARIGGSKTSESTSVSSPE